MNIEAVLRFVLGIAAVLALAAGAAAYRNAGRNSVVYALVALIGAWSVVTAGGGIYLTSRVGPVARSEGILLALALIGALIGGLAAGKRKIAGLSHVSITWVCATLVLFDLTMFYHLNHALVEVATELGYGATKRKYEPTANKDCPASLKSLYFAFSQYAEGNGSLPPADKWMDNDEIASKVQKEEWFHCPEVSNRHDSRYGYAYNDAIAGRQLNGKKLNEMPDAARTPLLYDSSNLNKSAHDPFSSLPKPGRHGGFNVVLYCDGHLELKL